MKTKNYCPLLKKECIEHKCAWYYHVQGRDANTGQDLNEWQCAVNLIPLLMVEIGKQQHSTAAAIESFRNESVVRNDATNSLLGFIASASPVEEVKVGLIGEAT